MVTDQQVRKLMKLTQTEKTKAIAAAKAGMDEKTARKYRRLGQLPSQLKKPRWWRTRSDIFHDVWPEIEAILRTDPGIEVITIFDYLGRKITLKRKSGQSKAVGYLRLTYNSRTGVKRV